ncbi:hypothetical protein BST36_26150 [Mycolicibacterium moriokaense]|jgi:Mce-associated membrane protein|uniref:Mce-associated membrane protein n=2 Tax=Mycolicibacterium moriokaense TaxID=39691 RepID=A0AAD1H921_9MYCO|nr:hypothetical protein [Mycolicibacterium moriokaense]ORB16234.1 hypothetical protein BST36_26150 [Mycolicibacterium moriokaense]BBX01045.1 hypothetical protein MMOR_19810 [Mycolicibacterium moriokaense]
MPAGGAKSDKESAEVTEEATTEESKATEEAPTEETSDATEASDAADKDTKDTEDAKEDAETAEEWPESSDEPEKAKRKIQWSRVVAYGILPGLALLLALGAGYARWQYTSSNYSALPPAASEQHPSPAMESMNAARDSTIKMLSYKPDTVGEQLNAARDLLTGDFRDSYTTLINDVVIPGAQQKQISAVASVPAVASVSADPKHAVVLVFVNQTVVVGQDLPSDTASSVRVTLDKIDGRWLISEFEPV